MENMTKIFGLLFLGRGVYRAVKEIYGIRRASSGTSSYECLVIM